MSPRFPLKAVALLAAIVLLAGLAGCRRSGLSDPAADEDPLREKPAPVPEEDPFGGDEAATPRPNTAGPRTPHRAKSTTVVLQPAEATIEKALAEPASLDFVKTQLQDVVAFLCDEHKINVVIDQRRLEDMGIGTDTRITIYLRNVSLRTALDLMLRQLDLTWTIRSEVLLITTPEEAETMLVTKVYEVRDLVTCRDEKHELSEDYDTLVQTITLAIEPASWDESGGPGTITGAAFGSAKVLTVSQTYRGHRQVATLLEKLRELSAKKGGNGKPR